MKPTNQLDAELKAYVFAQYYGQNVFKKISSTDVVWPLTYDRIGRITPNSVLQLRSLSSITDQEAIEVAKILLPGIEFATVHRGAIKDCIVVCTGTNDIYIHFDGHLVCMDSTLDIDLLLPLQALSAYQYLQQQGFALPVFFKGTHYTVERLISEGVIVIAA